MAAPSEIADLLDAHAFTRGLDRPTRELLAGCARNVSFAADAAVFREGDPADWFYLLRRGTVALEMRVPGRGRIAIQTLQADEILGVSWLFPPYRWTFDARAVTPAGAVAFDASCLRGKCDADHELGYQLMARFAPKLSERLQAARLQLADLYGTRDARAGA
jgi:CRP-like cAMP-binding protein